MNLTIHVGLAKAASTYLQETFFPGLRDAFFVHAPYSPPSPADPIQRFVRRLLFRNPAGLDIPAVRREVADYLAGHGRVIISSEALFGTPFVNHSDFRTNTDVMAEVFEQPKIWLVIRRQDRWLESIYSQFLKMGLSTTPHRFMNYRDGEFGDYRWIYGGPNLDVRDLDWGCFVRYYHKLFGRERVFVQPFEAFTADRAAFLHRFCAFADVAPFVPEETKSVNPSLSPVSAAVARLANAIPMPVKVGLKRYIPPSLHPARILNRTLDPLLKRRHLIPPELGEKALAMHRDNNRALADLLGEDLASFGYY